MIDSRVKTSEYLKQFHFKADGFQNKQDVLLHLFGTFFIEMRLKYEKFNVVVQL